MAQIIKELRVDVSQPNVFQAIVAKQHDSNSRFLKITLVDFGVKVEVPNTAKVTINANRPDGASESFKGEANNDGTITVPLAQWMLDIDGEVKCDVSVTNTEDNKRLTSTDFWLEVQKAANPNASIPLDPDGEILIIKPVTEINENSKDTDYPSAKAVYNLDNITASASGSAITVDSAKAPLQNLKLFGKTEQLGTPTPEAPVPLVSVGDSGSFEVKIQGENAEEQTLTVPYPLRSHDGVQDEIDFSRGVLIKRVFYADNFYLVDKSLANMNVFSQQEGNENLLPTGTAASNFTNHSVVAWGDNVHLYNSKGAINVFVPKTIDATEVTNTLRAICLYAMPVEIPLSETELNAYRQLYTNKGNTTILSEAEMEVDYYINKPNAQAIGSLHGQINKDYLKLQQAIISTGGNV